MKYADKEFYENEYGGDLIPSAELDAMLTKSSHAIDRATYYRIGELDRFPPFTQRQVKLATCAEADAIKTIREETGVLAEIGSYSIGDVTVSAKSGADAAKASDGLTGHYQLSEEALGFLLPTGLLNRRI